MRFYAGKRVGKTHVGVSMDAGKLFKWIGYIFLSPFYLTYYVCIWPFIKLAQALKKKSAQPAAGAAAAPTRAAAGYSVPGAGYAVPGAAPALPYSFQAKSWYKHEKAIAAVCTRTPGFALSDEDFLAKYKSDRRVYQFKFKEGRADLEPEPTNTADPNAILVVVEGEPVGYVPREEQEVVRRILAQPHRVEVSMYGGPWKRNVNGAVEVGKSDYTVRVTLLPSEDGLSL